MSVYVPYLIKDPETGFVQNTTVVDIGGGDTVVLEVLPLPGRMACSCLSVSMAGATGQSDTRASPGKHGSPEGGGGMDSLGAIRVPANDSTFDTMEVHSVVMGGPVSVKFVPSVRQTTISMEEGGGHSAGLVHGRIVYDRLFELSDPTDTLDPVDGKAGYFDRWAGQGNAPTRTPPCT